MDLVEEGEVATAAAIAAAMVEVIAAATVEVIAAATVEVIAAAMVEVIAAAMVEVIAAATAVVILNLTIAPTLINLLEQKVGKIEVMENLLKTQNMKVGEAEEKGEFLMRVMLQKR